MSHQRRTHLANRLRSHLALVLVLGLALVGNCTLPAAEAHWEQSKYTYDPVRPGHAGCDHGIDPITVLFRGYQATFARVKSHIAYHLWGRFGSGSTQAIMDHGLCFNMQGQLANGGTFGRYHVRLWTKVHGTDDGRIVTIGDAHHEDLTTCGHAVDMGTKQNPTPNGSGFDLARRRMVRLFKSGKVGGPGGTIQESRPHSITHHDWGNSRPFRQCDGEYAGSNGDVAIIGMD